MVTFSDLSAPLERDPSAVLDADLLTLPQVADLSRAHTNSVHRWIRSGTPTARGDRAYLPHVRLGRRVYVLRVDLERFLDAVAGKVPAARRRAPRAATREILEEAGISR